MAKRSSVRLTVYLNQEATKWVSLMLLLGCIAITIFLVFAAIKAGSLGERLSPVYDVESWEDY